MAFLVLLSACSQSTDPDANIACKTRRVAAYNPKDLNQCVDACIACDNGVMTTCTTSCTLKGAR